MKLTKHLPSAITLAAILAFGATGCFKHSYSSGAGGNTQARATYSEWHSHFFFGVIGEKDVDVKRVCPTGNATIKDEVSFVNGIIGALVGVIYYPSTVEVYCDTGKTATLTIPAEALVRIGRDPRTLPVVRQISEDHARELADALVRSENRRVASERAPATF